MYSIDMELTLVGGPLRLSSALEPHLAPILLIFRPATNQDRPAANLDPLVINQTVSKITILLQQVD